MHTVLIVIAIVLAVLVVAALVSHIAYNGIHRGREHDRNVARRRRSLLGRSRRDADRVAQ
ncbi:MAG TPA: hypothetical protein VE982_02825 [Gaiellaceae bacterium]|nr:hypothetical protein [Gaiellaceae bacterium]